MAQRPSNWCMGVFYYNKKDNRIFPPKRVAMMGQTISFANPYSYLNLIFLLVIFFFLVYFIFSRQVFILVLNCILLCFFFAIGILLSHPHSNSASENIISLWRYLFLQNIPLIKKNHRHYKTRCRICRKCDGLKSIPTIMGRAYRSIA